MSVMLSLLYANFKSLHTPGSIAGSLWWSLDRQTFFMKCHPIELARFRMMAQGAVAEAVQVLGRHLPALRAASARDAAERTGQAYVCLGDRLSLGARARAMGDGTIDTYDDARVGKVGRDATDGAGVLPHSGRYRAGGGRRALRRRLLYKDG
jgi:hypothetical protein